MVGSCFVLRWTGANDSYAGVHVMAVGSCGLGMGENVVGCRYVQGVDKETERGDYGERSCYE